MRDHGVVQDERALDAAHLLGRQAGIYYHYGVPSKHELPKKVFGVFDHDVVKNTSPAHARGFDDTFKAPHSRHTEVLAEDIESAPGARDHRHLEGSPASTLPNPPDSSNFFVFGHPRVRPRNAEGRVRPPDVARGLDVALPAHYYPEDDPSRQPASTWRSHAQLLTPTGSTTTSTRPRPTTSTPSVRRKRRNAPDQVFHNFMRELFARYRNFMRE